MPIPVPTVACANVKVGVPTSVVSSPAWTSDRPAIAGRVTWPVASVVASYWRCATVNVPVTVSERFETFAVVVAIEFGE